MTIIHQYCPVRFILLFVLQFSRSFTAVLFSSYTYHRQQVDQRLEQLEQERKMKANEKLQQRSIVLQASQAQRHEKYIGLQRRLKQENEAKNQIAVCARVLFPFYLSLLSFPLLTGCFIIERYCTVVFLSLAICE